MPQARITFVPAQHWSQRGLTDRCHTLWGGYVVQTKQPHPQTFYFAGEWALRWWRADGSAQVGAERLCPCRQDHTHGRQACVRVAVAAGDTGYCDVFKEIGERLGPMDLSAIPTGAYEPRWFMRPQHVNAEEGLQVRARLFLAGAAAWAALPWARHGFSSGRLQGR